MSVWDAEPKVVGTIHSPASLEIALKLAPDAVDLLEIRLDAFSDLTPLRQNLSNLSVPLLITARHPAEGGANALSTGKRCALFEEFLPFASFVDVELRSVAKMEAVLNAARRSKVRVIISSHYFSNTPPVARLTEIIRESHAFGADICKIATLASTPAQLVALLSVFTKKQPLPLAVMGMGSLGKISRLLLAKTGSVLNYGYLDKPNASGQWEAALLKKRIAELREDLAI